MLVDYLTDYLELIVSISLDIGLQSFLAYNLVGSTFNLNLDLERISLEDHKFIPEVRGVLINRNPDSHCVILQLTVHLIHIEAIIKILLQPDYILQALPSLPLVHLGLQPSFLLQYLEPPLAAEELGDKEVALVIVAE